MLDSCPNGWNQWVKQNSIIFSKIYFFSKIEICLSKIEFLNIFFNSTGHAGHFCLCLIFNEGSLSDNVFILRFNEPKT